MSTAVVASLMMLVIIPDITFLRGGSLVAKLFRSFAGHSGNINLLLVLTNTRPGRVAEETCLAGGRGFTSLLGLPCKLQKNTESSLGEPGILFTEGGDPRREGLVFGGAPSSTLLGGKVLLLSVIGWDTRFPSSSSWRRWWWKHRWRGGYRSNNRGRWLVK